MKYARLLPALLVALALLLASSPVAAITYGEPDGERHPYVGTIFVDSPEGLWWICSGSLISPTVFVTAGHCTERIHELGGPATVIFASAFGPGMVAHPVAQAITGPNYFIGERLPTHGDIGVLIMQSPIYLSQYAELPTAGLLDSLATQRGRQDLSVTIVGYGTIGIDNPYGGKPAMTFNYRRNMTPATILNLRSHMTDGENVQISGNPGQGRGGACFGDSGGPTLLGDSHVMIGVNSFVFNNNCAGTAFAYRTDIADARAFLSQFVELP
ncbi:MAG: trypsin-like serine protease [Chloroflexi bacterium]|nr:trypsin-like serine protease [Chloroflexota bacterium]